MVIQDEKKLRQISLPCNSFEEGMEIADKLKEEVIHHSAYGLSAIQIGIPKRVFIMRTNKDEDWTVIINPTLESQESDQDRMFYEEGCLSFPGIKVVTHRPSNIVVINTIKDGKTEKYALSDLDAIVFQHELDHLNGKLMFDRRALSVPQSHNLGKDKINRNDICPCGSKKKYKKCCGK